MLGVPCHLLEKRSPLLHIACSCKLHREQLGMKKRSMVMFKIKACQVAFVCTVQVPPPSSSSECYLTIIPRARMGMEVEGRMGYRLRGHESEKNNCFSKIQLVGKKYRDKTALTSKTRFSLHCFGFQSRRFSLLVGYNIYPQQLNQSERSIDNRPLVGFYALLCGIVQCLLILFKLFYFSLTGI